jgi:hypothetical protein
MEKKTSCRTPGEGEGFNQIKEFAPFAAGGAKTSPRNRATVFRGVHDAGGSQAKRVGRLRLIHIVAALALACCGGRVTSGSGGGAGLGGGDGSGGGGSSASGGSSGAAGASGAGGSEGTPGSGGSEGSSGAGGTSGSPADASTAFCVLSSSKDVCSTTPPPCWTCASGELYSSCPPAPAAKKCSSQYSCLLCDDGAGTLFDCTSTRGWIASGGSMTCAK